MNVSGLAAFRRAAVISGLVIPLLAAIAWLLIAFQPREPICQGRPLESWLREFDHPYDSTNYTAARAAILQMGTNVLPHLERYLRHKDWRYKRQWTALQAELHLLSGGVDYDWDWHRRAAKACGQFGEAGAPAFAAMAEAAQDPRAAHDVANSLSWMLPKSAPVLISLLASTNPTTRYRAADALATAPSHPQVVVMARTALLGALRDPDKGLRMAAAGALGLGVGISTEHRDAVIPALTEALSDPDPSVRGNAATSLGNYGTNARAAVPKLVKLLEDTNAYPRERSAAMLWKIDPETATKLGVGAGN